MEKVLPKILPVIIGTSGHVDHGKTSLVQLLTGCNTDRLSEEKKRGLTIDLGFAPCHFPGNRLAGIVDVPGHEDFIRNMVAGASSIDVLMLIVAADDGVMPQTREHLQIIKLLRMPKVMAVITKADIVDPEMVELVIDDVKDLLADAGLEDAPVLPMSNKTLDGIKAVRETLCNIIDNIEPKIDPRAFRMNVERVFSVKGYGTVVTGIPVSGCLEVGGKVELLNATSIHPVRAVQSYKLDSDRAFAGACSAINLRDLESKDVSRGMTIAMPNSYQLTSSLIASVKNVSKTITLKNNGTVKFHAGTAVTQASVKFLNAEIFTLGTEALVHIKLVKPLVLASGDKFVLRSLTPVTTFAGGVVLTSEDYRVKKKSPGLIERLRKAKASAELDDFPAAALYAGKNAIVSNEQIKLLVNLEGACLESTIDKLVQDDVLFPLVGDSYLVLCRLPEIEKSLGAILSGYHKSHPYVWGIDPGHLCSFLETSEQDFKPLSKILCKSMKFKVQHGKFALSDYSPTLSIAQIELRENVLRLAEQGGVNAPAVGNIIKEFGVSKTDVKLISRLLVEEKLVVQIGANILSREALRKCREIFLDIFRQNSMVTLKEFREASGAGRNLAVAILEYFDSAGFSRRTGDSRVIENENIKF